MSSWWCAGAWVSRPENTLETTWPAALTPTSVRPHLHRWIDESCLCKRTKENLLYGREGRGVIDHPPVRVAELDCDLTADNVQNERGIHPSVFCWQIGSGETLFNVEDAGDEIFFGPGVVAWRYDRQIIGLD